jgi:hypothetical protein
MRNWLCYEVGAHNLESAYIIRSGQRLLFFAEDEILRRLLEQDPDEGQVLSGDRGGDNRNNL